MLFVLLGVDRPISVTRLKPNPFRQTVYVIEGLGSLKYLDEESDAVHTLRSRSTVELKKRK